jgi:hypothetical protein
MIVSGLALAANALRRRRRPARREATHVAL